MQSVVGNNNQAGGGKRNESFLCTCNIAPRPSHIHMQVFTALLQCRKFLFTAAEKSCVGRSGYKAVSMKADVLDSASFVHRMCAVTVPFCHLLHRTLLLVVVLVPKSL